MKIRCIAEYPSPEQIDQLGKEFYPHQTFGITIGREYLAYGIEFVIASSLYGTGALVNLVSDYNHLSAAPLCLFEITDGRVSRFWECRMSPDGWVTLWPPSFYREFYHDDLAEGVSEVVEDFRSVRAMLESEFEQ